MNLLENLEFTTPRKHEEYLETERTRIIEEHLANGLKVLEPGPLIIQVDHDAEDLNPFFERLERFQRNFGPTRFFVSTSKGGRKHIHLEFPPGYGSALDPFARVAWQLWFLSDPIREMMNLKRLTRGDPVPVMLLETPAEAERVLRYFGEAYQTPKEPKCS